MTDGLMHIGDLLPGVIDQIDRRAESAQWPLVKRNQAIAARNRNMKQICEMLGTEYRDMPLEQVEELTQ